MKEINVPASPYSGIRIMGIIYVTPDTHYTVSRHRHPGFEFIYCLSGEIEQWVNDELFLLKANEGLFIQPGIYHHISSVKAGTVLFDILFDVEDPKLFSLYHHHQSLFFNFDQKQIQNMEMPAWMNKNMRFISETNLHLNSSSNNIEADRSIFLLRVHSTFLELINFLISIVHQRKILELVGPKVAHNSKVMLAHEIAHFLEQHVFEGITIQELSNKLNFHRTYVSKCFKEVYGISPKDFLSTIKINKARTLLQETEISIERLAQQLCFSSAGHFSSRFRSETSMTPSQFRNHFVMSQSC